MTTYIFNKPILSNLQRCNYFLGAKSSLTVAARRMLGVCVDRLHEKEERLMLLEKAINPLLDDNDQVALTFILDNVVGKVKTMSEAWPFMKPVNRKLVKDYYNVIKQPIDLETIASRVSSEFYTHFFYYYFTIGILTNIFHLEINASMHSLS